MMRVALHILVLYTLLYVAAAAVNIYIESPVTIFDCRSPRQDDQWSIGTTESTTHITEKPANPLKFYEAARDGDLEYIENEISRLGTSGLNLDWQNEYGSTALYVAALNDNLNIVSTLLTAGADPNVQDNAGWTSVYFAVKLKKIDLLRFLLDSEYQFDVNLPDNANSWTPVFKAAWEGYCDILELLLTKGHGDPNTVSDFGTTPLMTATAGGHSDCARALLAAGAHVNYVRPSDGETSLHKAAEYNQPDLALMLLEAGANKDIEDNEGRTPADVARKRDHDSLAQIIDNY